MCLGIPGEVVAAGDRPGTAVVDVGGARRQINVMLIEDEGVNPGDWVLIHVGFAMARIDEDEARLTLAHLEEMGRSYQDELRALAESHPR
jgi:hydrogenase expression/formation protein HypC